MSILKGLGANILSKFVAAVGSTVATKTASSRNSVTYNSSVGGTPYSVDVKQKLAQVEWSRGYSWDVYIDPAPPSPFDGTGFGLPISEVMADFALTGRTSTFDFANSTYNFPTHRDFYTIGLQFFDDAKGTMESYFEDWQELVYSYDGADYNNGTVNYLSESVRMIRITKLDGLKKEIFTRNFLVYPAESMKMINNSQGGVRTFSIDLMVAGYLGKTRGGNFNATKTVSGKIIS